MNRINVVIVNPAFLTLFLGAPVLAVILAAVRRDPLTIAAAVAAVVAIVITFAVNVPLNDALADGGTRNSIRDAVGPVALLPHGRRHRRVRPPVHPGDSLTA